MPRATEAEVLQIIDTTLTSEEVTPFLSAANLLVSSICVDVGYSDDLLEEVERWLTAHLIAVRDPRVSKEKIGDANVEYHGRSGLGLDHTPYGQQVKILEYQGKLAELDTKKRPAEVKTIA